MDIEALLEQYVSENADKEKYVRTVVCAFSERGIEQPTETDYKETLKGYLQEKCITGKSSYYNYRSAGKDFYAWIGDKIMDTELESEVTDVTATRETEPPKTENESVQADFDMNQESETPEPLENEPTNELVQSVSDVAGKNEPPVKEETPIESVQAGSVPTEPQKAKDSPKKSKNENRTQISAFLSNEVYLSIKALAFSTQQPISDIVAQVLSAFCEDNAEVIQDSITAMQKLESVKSRIKYHR